MSAAITRGARRRPTAARLAPALLASALLATGCRLVGGGGAAPAIPARQAATFPAEWRFRAGQPATTARHAMVVSVSPEASEAGLEILRKGGNAVDAAVATGFALAVTLPSAGNIGGGGYMVIRMADGRAAALDYREIAPLAATRDMYLDSTGKLTNRSVVGHLAVGVPGAVAGMAEALRKYGTLSLADAMAPAIRLARDGFVVDSALQVSLNSSRELLVAYEGKRVYFPGDSALRAGTVWRQPELARTLQLIADRGPRAFYEEEIADSLVAEMRRGGGIVTKADLARYQPVWREPIRATYRGYSLVTMPPSSSGGTTIAESMNMLETRAAPAFGSAQWAHLLGGAYQRAFIDRNAKLGDPAFVRVPVDTLTSKAYARQLAATIDPARATPTPVLAATMTDGQSTTHYSVVDASGNAVATTTTLNNSYGSGVWVRGAGFLLNDEMDDFAAQPGQPNMFGLVQGEANAIVPGKRMLSAMSPTIVLDPRGQLLMVVGAAGGPRIITTTSQVVLNVIDQRMTLADAMHAPRLHHQALPDTLMIERNGVTPAVRDSLAAMGHAVRETGALATANAIMRVGGGWEGVSEPRVPKGRNGAKGY